MKRVFQSAAFLNLDPIRKARNDVVRLKIFLSLAVHLEDRAIMNYHH